jgi:hypothetical protein
MLSTKCHKYLGQGHVPRFPCRAWEAAFEVYGERNKEFLTRRMVIDPCVGRNTWEHFGSPDARSVYNSDLFRPR